MTKTEFKKQKENIETNEQFFDCRNYIHKGDKIEYLSMFGSNSSSDTSRHNYVQYTGIVESVYKKFIFVKIKHGMECVNRWDILKVNRRNVVAGCFDRHLSFMDSIDSVLKDNNICEEEE